VSGPLLVAALLLAGAGMAKALRPYDTARALRRAGLPVGAGGGVVRTVALAELAIGIAAMFVSGPVPAVGVAASYAAFAAFLALALGRGWSLSSCGCFGEPDTPPTPLHLVLDVALATGAALAATARRAPLAEAAHRPLWGVGLLAASVVTAGLVYLVMARLPHLKVVPE
jgi:hypothetical protein